MPSLICKAMGPLLLLALVEPVVFAQTSLFTPRYEHHDALLQSNTGKLFRKIKKPVYRPDTTHKPAVAIKRSAMIPGWGQLYNHAWWKLPVVYTTLGLFGRSIIINQRSYKQYLEVYKLVKDPKRPRPPIGDLVHTLYNLNARSDLARIDAIQSNYQRNMQLSILGFVGFWGVQMIDAYIDAKFIHSYTIDRNLSLDVSPGLITTGVAYTAVVPAVVPVMKLLVTM